MPLDNICTTHPFIPPVIIYTAPLLNHSRVCGSSQFRILPLSIKRQASRGLRRDTAVCRYHWAAHGCITLHEPAATRQSWGHSLFHGPGGPTFPPSLPHQRKSVYLGNRQAGLPERPPPTFLPPPQKGTRPFHFSQPASEPRQPVCNVPQPKCNLLQGCLSIVSACPASDKGFLPPSQGAVRCWDQHHCDMVILLCSD